jgi:hypothetical protein
VSDKGSVGSVQDAHASLASKYGILGWNNQHLGETAMNLFRSRRVRPAAPAAATADKVLPRALGWAVLDNGSDLIVVIPTFSSRSPISADFQVLDRAPAIANGEAADLALVVYYGDGSRRRFALTKHDDAALVDRLTGMPDFVISEADSTPGGGNRYVYMATVVDRRKAPGPGMP